MSPEPRYPTVVIELEESLGDLVSGLLFELGASGVEERDQTTFAKGPAAGRVLLVASFDDHPLAEEACRSLREEYDHGFEPRIEEVVGDAWRDEWKKYYEPFALTPSITVRPPWHESSEQQDGKLVLTLEPGRAFGTGLHATTSLVAAFLEEQRDALSGAHILDAGCGSGILSFVALLLGAERASMFDIDPEVLPTVNDNAKMNGLSARCRVFAGTIADVADRFPWVLANIEARILEPIAEQLASAVGPGGHLVLSGILTAEEARMRQVFSSLARKFEIVGAKHMATGGERAHDKDGWVALHLCAVD